MRQDTKYPDDATYPRLVVITRSWTGFLSFGFVNSGEVLFHHRGIAGTARSGSITR